MIGQSVVHTGSRKVSTTARPRSRARETRAPAWLVRANGKARKLVCSGDPFTASVRSTSGLGTRRGDRHRRRADDHDGPRADRAGDLEEVDRRARRSGRRDRRRLGGSHGEPADAEQERRRHHRVGVGADAAEDPEVLDEHPHRGTADEPGDDADRHEPAAPREEADPDDEQPDDGREVHAPAVLGVEAREGSHGRREDGGLGDLGHLARHRRERPGSDAAGTVPRPRAPTRPRLQHAHSDEQRAERLKDPAPEHRGAPRRLREGEEKARGDVEERRARQPEEPAPARREDAAEGLAEHPHDQPPAGGHKAGRAGPRRRAVPRAGRSRCRAGSTPPTSPR